MKAAAKSRKKDAADDDGGEGNVHAEEEEDVSDDDHTDEDNDDEGVKEGRRQQPAGARGGIQASSVVAKPRHHHHQPAPSSLSSGAAAAAAAAAAAPPKRKAAAKDRDRPKRALSMFNFFFREEREKLMAERASGTGALAEADQRGIAEGKDANTRKKELFALVGKIIAERWKVVPPDELERLKALADQDMLRFNDEMSEYQINIARKKRVKEEASAASEAKVSGSSSVDDRRFPMYPREPSLNLYQPLGSPVPASLSMAAASFQRPGLSVDDQLQRDPSLRLPTPIEDLLRARRQAVLGDYPPPTSPNTAPSHSPLRHQHPRQGGGGLAFQDPLGASLSSSGLIRRMGSEGLPDAMMMPSTLLGAGASAASASARPYAPSLDTSMGGSGSASASAYETQQQLLMQLLQQDRYRLMSGSSALDPLSGLGMGRQVGGYPHAAQPSSLAAVLGSYPAHQQQQHALQQQQQQYQQLRQWPEAQSSLLASSSDALLSQLQRQERDMVALLRQQQQQQQQQQSLSDAATQQMPTYQELLRMQQLQHQQQMEQQEQSHMHLRRARRDSDSDDEPDPYP